MPVIIGEIGVRTRINGGARRTKRIKRLEKRRKGKSRKVGKHRKR